MATLKFKGTSYTVDHAAKGTDYIHGYDADGNCIVSIEGISDFSAIEYDGTYLQPQNCLAEAGNIVKYCAGVLQTADGRAKFLPYREDPAAPGCYKKQASFSEDAEWLNPQMLSGFYRTAERILNKPVYAKYTEYTGLSQTFTRSTSEAPSSVKTYPARLVDITGVIIKHNTVDGTSKLYPIGTCDEISIEYDADAYHKLTVSGTVPDGYTYDVCMTTKYI